MSRDIKGAATIQANAINANSILYKGNDISKTINPDLVKRTSLQPLYNENDELEHRVYYSLHNDASNCVFVSPHLYTEVVNKETVEVIPNVNGQITDNEAPIPIIPKPPIRDIPPDEEEEVFGGGGAWGGGGYSGGSSSNSSSSSPRTDFDNYAAEVVQDAFNYPNINSTHDVIDWYVNRTQMTTAKNAMAYTRNPYNGRGCRIQETYANLLYGQSMYEGSSIYTASLGIPKLINGRRMFYNCPHLEIITLNRANNITDAVSMCEGADMLQNFTIRDSHQLTNATAMFKGCKDLEKVTMTATNALEIVDSMFEGCSSAPTFTGQINFPVATSAVRMFANSGYKKIEAKFPELQNGTEMMCDCKNLKEIKSGTNLPNLTNATRMYKGCSQLTTDNTVSYPMVTNAEEMYSGCVSLVSANSTFLSLTEGTGFFKNCKNLREVNLNRSFPSLQNGSEMCYGCEDLLEIECNVPSLLDGSKMFKNCSKLGIVVFEGPVVTNAESMFENISPVYISVNLPEATNINRIFKGTSKGRFIPELTINPETAIEAFANSGILEFRVDGLPRLTNAERMFYKCKNLKTVHLGKVDVLSSIDGLFSSCPNLTEIEGEFPAVTGYQDSPFSGCSRLKTAVVDFSALMYAPNMFRNMPELYSVTGDFSNLTTATGMFMNCPKLRITPSTPAVTSAQNMYVGTPITSIPSLPNLVMGRGAFMDCTQLKGAVDTSVFPNLDNGINMFNGCTGITSVALNLSGVSDVRNMFALCPNITRITSASFKSGVQAQSILGQARVDYNSFMIVYNAIKNANASPDENGCVCHVGVTGNVISQLSSEYGGTTCSDGEPMFSNWEGNQFYLRLNTSSNEFVMAVNN